MSRRIGRGVPAADVEAVVTRAATLLRGGLPAARVWIALGEESSESSELVGISARIALGTPVADSIAAVGEPAWRLLAAAWEIAELSGAPLADALDRLAASIRALRRAAERRSVLLSGPRATVRLVIALPPLALALGGMLGFDPVPVLLSPAGMLLVGGGAGLLGLGGAWARALIARVARADRPVGWALELSWISIGGGGPPTAALRRVADCADRLAVEWVPLADLRSDGAVRSTLRTAASLGSPAGPLLLGAADAARGRAEAELERQAERLAVRVLAPLGVCVLPAFVLLGVAPVVISMLGAVPF